MIAPPVGRVDYNKCKKKFQEIKRKYVFRYKMSFFSIIQSYSGIQEENKGKMNFSFFFCLIIAAVQAKAFNASKGQGDALNRSKRDLIGWNRTSNTFTKVSSNRRAYNSNYYKQLIAFYKLKNDQKMINMLRNRFTQKL